jgi:hypothetical protein
MMTIAICASFNFLGFVMTFPPSLFLLGFQSRIYTAIVLSSLSRSAASAARPFMTTWPRSMTTNWSQTGDLPDCQRRARIDGAGEEIDLVACRYLPLHR